MADVLPNYKPESADRNFTGAAAARQPDFMGFVLTAPMSILPATGAVAAADAYLFMDIASRPQVSFSKLTGLPELTPGGSKIGDFFKEAYLHNVSPTYRAAIPEASSFLARQAAFAENATANKSVTEAVNSIYRQWGHYCVPRDSAFGSFAPLKPVGGPTVETATELTCFVARGKTLAAGEQQLVTNFNAALAERAAASQRISQLESLSTTMVSEDAAVSLMKSAGKSLVVGALATAASYGADYLGRDIMAEKYGQNSWQEKFFRTNIESPVLGASLAILAPGWYKIPAFVVGYAAGKAANYLD